MSISFIQMLAERLAAADPANAQEQREIFERIRELRSAFDGPLDPESHRRLEAAGMLVAYLARMGSLAGEDVRAIAVRLLRMAAEAEGGASRANRPAAAAPAAPPAGRGAFPVIRVGQPPAVVPSAPPGGDDDGRSATDVMSDMLLGQILLQRGQILEEHIHQAMKVQRTTPLRFGDVLVKIGACTRQQVSDALAHQASLRRVRENLHEANPPKERAPILGTSLKLVGEALLGEILIERNVITRRQLERALEAQKQTGQRIGDTLVKIGATTMEQIEQALRVQGRERRFGKGSPSESKGSEGTKR
jgi:hypothetical protein